METLIGRLNHVAYLMDMLRHFMSRFHMALHRTTLHRFTFLRLCEKEDLKLMLYFLQIAALNGVSMNNLYFRKPTHIYRSDASLHGIGGYSILSGKAWRFHLPINCRLRTTLNSLEFIACLVAIWIDYLHGDICSESCIPSQTDSTSAAGWLKKSNFTDSTEEVVQLYTSIVLDASSCFYSQWFPGKDNEVSYACSRDFHLSDNELKNLILTSVPHQVPFGFKIYRIPDEIASWLTCTLLKQPQTTQWNQPQIQSKLSLGVDTNSISTRSQLNLTTTLITSPNFNASKSSEHLHKQSKKADLILENLLYSNQTLVEPPSIAWHRPSAWQIYLTHVLTKMENLHLFYKGNIEDTRS
jgi:hypothetical protein